MSFLACFTFIQDIFEQQLLRGVSFFQHAKPALLEALSQKLHPKVVDKGEIIFNEGAKGEDMYLVAKGFVAIYQKKTKIAELGPGSCFGEMALLSNEPRNARVMALERTQLLYLKQHDFHNVIEQWPSMRKYIKQLQKKRHQKKESD